MKYFSLDMETTTVDYDERNHTNIIGVSIVFEDTQTPKPLVELPHFTCLINQGVFKGGAYALSMNAAFLKMIAESSRKTPKYPVYTPLEWQARFALFVKQYSGGKKLSVAGKNVAGFDFSFLPTPLKNLFASRAIDVGQAFMSWSEDEIPNMQKCMDLAGVQSQVTHDMYLDALDNIACLRTKY